MYKLGFGKAEEVEAADSEQKGIILNRWWEVEA